MAEIGGGGKVVDGRGNWGMGRLGDAVFSMNSGCPYGVSVVLGAVPFGDSVLSIYAFPALTCGANECRRFATEEPFVLRRGGI
jgi:hypothetical protein